MINYTQILNQKKHVNANVVDGSLMFSLESDKKDIVEYNMFDQISRTDQFYSDKLNCSYFRFYGKINQTFNLKYNNERKIYKITLESFTLVNGFRITINGKTKEFGAVGTGWGIQSLYESLTQTYAVEIYRGDFRFELNDEFIYLIQGNEDLIVSGSNYPITIKLQSTKPEIMPSYKSINVITKKNWKVLLMGCIKNNYNKTKGDNLIRVYDSTIGWRDLYFSKGLPALVIPSETINNKSRVGLLLYLGHNFKVNDILKLTLSKVDNRYKNGIYRVSYVKGNKIFLQFLKSIAGEQPEPDPPNIDAPIVEAIVGGIELGIPLSTFNQLKDATDVNWLAVYNPNIYVKKVINNIESEYYLTKLYYLDEIKDIFDCAFSNNIYNTQVANFVYDNKLDVSSYVDNLNAPISEIYATFIKTVDETQDMTNVLASFKNFVTSTYDDGNVQIVSRHFENNTGVDIDYINKSENNFVYHSLVEFNLNTLDEVVINRMEHTFIVNKSSIKENRSRLYYNPFFKIALNKKSSQISESSVNIDIPSWAKYDPNKDKYVWRNILDVGYFEGENNGVDFPYFNDSFYVYCDFMFNIKNSFTSRINSILSGGYLLSNNNEINEDPISVNTTGVIAIDDSLLYENKYDKPYETYSDLNC